VDVVAYAAQVSAVGDRIALRADGTHAAIAIGVQTVTELVSQQVDVDVCVTGCCDRVDSDDFTGKNIPG